MKILNHLRTITHHRHLVMRHCFLCGIPVQGMKHDLSKYGFVEFKEGCKYYTGTRSPNEGERKEKGYSEAWMHHKGRNKHHFEYWTDVSPVSHRYEPVKMPYNYLAEMVCDRIAASKTYRKKEYTDSCPLEYFLSGYGKAQMHSETAKELEKLLTMLKEQGEKRTFGYIKEQLRRKKNDLLDY